MVTNRHARTICASTLALIAAGISSSALAQDSGVSNDAPPAPTEVQEEDASEFGSDGIVVVVGKLTDVAIDRERIELLQANDLRDLFRQTPSVNVGGSLGIAQKIYVRGLEDSQLNVTIDGAPQHGTLFHHIGRVSLEPELIESVELQAGAGEATAGFGAIGGAIRFRTRDASDLLRPGQDIGGIVKGGWFSNDGYKLSATAYGRLVGDVGLVGSYVYSDRDNFEDGDGVEIPGTRGEQHLGFVKLGGDVGGGHRFSLSYEHREEEGEFNRQPNWPAIIGATLYPGEGKRQTVVGNYGYDSGDALGAEVTAYWTKASFEQNVFDRWGRYAAEIETYGFDARTLLDFGAHEITAGIEHRNDSVAGFYPDDSAAGRIEERGELFGVYIQDHWQIADPLLLSFGARYDAYDLDQLANGTGTNSDGVSFNVGADYEILPGLTLNAGYAEAFRGKEIGDGFTVEGSTIQPNLKPERVGNLEVGAAYVNDGFSASVAYFDMEIEDVILDQLYLGTNYENVGDFTSEGVEVRAAYETGPFRVSAFYNHFDSRLNGNRINGYDYIALGNTMGDNWNVTAGYSPTPAIDLEASLTRFETVDDLESLFRDVEAGYSTTTFTIDKPGYTVVDLFASWRPLGDDRLSLYAAVYNLFDKRYISHASVEDYTDVPGYGLVSGIPEPGRNFRLSASYKF